MELLLWKEWVLGFVSGSNIYAEHPELLPAPIDARAIYAWIDNYCRSNPLDNLYDASFALVKDLLRRAEQKNHP